MNVRERVLALWRAHAQSELAIVINDAPTDNGAQNLCRDLQGEPLIQRVHRPITAISDPRTMRRDPEVFFNAVVSELK